MIWSIIVVLLVLWFLGFSFNLGGNFVHTLLVISLIVLIVHLLF